MSRTFSLDEFQQLVADAFSLTASPSSLPTTFESVASHTEHRDGRSYFDNDDDDSQGDIEQEGLVESSSSEYSSMHMPPPSVSVAAFRRSSASFITSMQFSAPSPSPSSVIRRRQHASLFTSFPLSPPPPFLSFFPHENTHQMHNVGQLHPLSVEDGCISFSSSSKTAGISSRFLKALKTRASRFRMFSTRTHVNHRTENAAVQTDATNEDTRPLEEYIFPPRPSTRTSDMNALSSAPGQLFTGVSSVSTVPLPVASQSPSSNMEPGLYTVSPKPQIKSRDHTSLDVDLSRSFLQMGLTQSQRPRRKRASSIPLEVLCLSSHDGSTRNNSKGDQASSNVSIGSLMFQMFNICMLIYAFHIA
jgi:hypothetical protein